MNALAEKIASLQKALESDDDEDSYASSKSESSQYRDSTMIVERDELGNPIKLTSLNEEDRIKPLPPDKLPKALCSKATLSGQKRPSNHNHQGEKRRAVSFQKAPIAYEPVSSEKKPFYCRFCKYQGESLEDLENHKASEDHKKSYQQIMRLSYCHLCKKQYTSPVQLEEHRKGKQHLERLQKVRSRMSNQKFEK